MVFDGAPLLYVGADDCLEAMPAALKHRLLPIALLLSQLRLPPLLRLRRLPLPRLLQYLRRQ